LLCEEPYTPIMGELSRCTPYATALIILIAFTPGLIRIPGSVYQNKL